MKKTLAVRAKAAHTLHVELLGLSRSATSHFFRLGEIMKQFRDNRLWETLGHDSFRAYFSDPELGFEESSVYRAIKIVEHFKLKELAHVPVGKLMVILPHVTDKNKAKLLEMAGSLPRGDLIHELGPGREKGVAPIPKIYRCNDCQGVKGITHLDLCKCGWTDGERLELAKLVTEAGA